MNDGEWPNEFDGDLHGTKTKRAVQVKAVWFSENCKLKVWVRWVTLKKLGKALLKKLMAKVVILEQTEWKWSKIARVSGFIKNFENFDIHSVFCNWKFKTAWLGTA